MKKDIAELRRRLLDIAHLSSASALMNWDQEVQMPEKAAGSRAAAIAYISGLVHSQFVALDSDGLLSKLKKRADAGKIRGADGVIIRETWRSFEREKKLPESFVKELAETTSKAQHVWADARAKNDFASFLPWLEKVVKLKRKEAEFVGYEESPYDALLDAYEPGMTAAEAAKILSKLKDFLVPFLKEVLTAQKKSKPLKMRGKFPLAQQKEFNRKLASAIGFDLDAGVIEESTHPFTSGFHPHDVRFTTRYREDDVLYAIGSTLHEAGHALYEQGLPARHFGTPLAESASLGIHESQSRMWENIIGKSPQFWKHFWPLLKKAFPKELGGVSREAHSDVMNTVAPSLIRTEADEVTYNLHIILRFEIEKSLIEGMLVPKDVPREWRKKMKELLGVEVKKDSDGPLQDVHWSCGLFGYFPTYAFGNLYSAQLFAAMEREIPGVWRKISEGDFREILAWLRSRVHIRGKTLRASELVKRATGETLDSRFFEEYLCKKYARLYKFSPQR